MTALLILAILAVGPSAPPPALAAQTTPALCTDAPELIQLGTPSRIGQKAACTASANCTEGPDVSCSGNSTCQAVDQNCPGTRGYVKCDGVKTDCPICPLSCTIPQCKAGCSCPGGWSICVSPAACECDCIYP